MFNHLYIHIPFCRKKCPYCAFFSGEPPGDDLDRYVTLLCEEMQRRSKQVSSRNGLDSIYFGGGTPSLLTPGQTEKLLELAASLFTVSSSAEITLEANPGTVDSRNLAGFRQTGVNRLSLGVQSFDDAMLAKLGRIHASRQAKNAFESARIAGFTNVGIDLIHSLPGQTADMWRRDLEYAIAMKPEHISVYGLTIEQDTPFAAMYPEGSTQLPDHDLSADMYEITGDLLTANGYEHYEIANYALPGFRSVHNCGYWRRDGYLGVGAGAHSLLLDSEFGRRSGNCTDMRSYADAVSNGQPAGAADGPLTRGDAMAEFMFLGLRMSDGVSNDSFRAAFGADLREIYGQQIDSLVAMGLVMENLAGLCLTGRGMQLSNQVFQRFLQ